MNKKGTAIVVTMIGVCVALLVGLIIAAQLYSTSQGFNLGIQGNATRETLFSTLWNAYNLVVIMLIVLAAAGILGAITWISGRR